MAAGQVHSGSRVARRVAWAVFGTVSTLALVGGVVADLIYGGGDHLIAVVVSGLAVIGVGAGLLASPSPKSDHAPSGVKEGNNSGGWSAL
jgi:hypothetical protein